jgi:hypothetical protein
MPSVEQLRERAKEHSRQLEAVLWVKVVDLVARWGVDAESITSIPRERLPYIEFGNSKQRRYDPRDVEEYERLEKKGAAA